MSEQEELEKQVARQAGRMKQAEKDRPTLLAQTSYIGTLGLVFVLPVIAGAYFGNWLDEKFSGYSVRWTLGFLLLGAICGGFNVYFLIGKGDKS
ncbi:MAG: F0F1 ATP synthase subunit [Alphaproteobacteria bacterium]|nr:F0F1 ATP synthase subunit [Alphaproteobacteria bacterium]